MFHKNSEKNQFGFYECGGLSTYSKLEAIEHANRTEQHASWNFNRENYRSWAWQQEPKEDLWDLYRMRAQEIRDRHDYIILMFSGGADSSNVLDVFLQSGIQLDELASYHQLNGSGSQNNYMDSEVFKVAYPRCRSVIEKHSNIRHRMIDWSSLVLDLLGKPEEIDRFVYTQNKFLTPSNICKPYLRESVPEWRDLIRSGARLALIWGANKPSLRVNHRGQTCYAYHDSNDFLVPVAVQNDNRPDYHDELFYNPVDTPIIACKQAHMIYRACQERPDNMMISQAWYHEHGHSIPRQQWLNSINGNVMIDQQKHYLKREAVHSVIYPHWDTETYTEGKPSSWIRNPRDNWLFEHNHPGALEIQNRIKRVYEGIGAKWLKDPKDWLQGLSGWYNEYSIV